MGLLDGKVVLITGAGGGIGRCHALACAAEGAKVVVNDLGGARDGTGAGNTMADAVVAEIVSAGGEAIPNFDSVTDYEGCERMVRAAVDTWGGLDVVVNNAGILRDRTFAKLQPAEWDAVVDVHLTGTRNVVRAALDALKMRGGAIINTTSFSGMIGNFGQSNYAAAKAGIYGLTRVLALELRKYGVTANCIAPVAKTRMTDDIAMVADEWGPEQISPPVVFLASDLAKHITGTVLGVQGQRIHLYEVKTNDGAEKAGPELWTPGEISERWSEITDWGKPADPAIDSGSDDRISAVFSYFPAGFKSAAVPGWTANIQWVVDGAADQTVIVEGGSARVQSGLHGTPTCTVKIASDTLAALFKGEIDAAKVFMTGKATADNMGDLMKMGMAFDFEKSAAAYAADHPEDAAAEEPAEAPIADVPTAEDLVGKRYDAGYWLVDQDEFEAYARATDDDNPAYFGADAVAPPMYHVKPMIGLMMKMATDPSLQLDILRLVHGEHEMTFHRPLRHGDVLQLRGDLRSVEEKSSGKLVKYGVYGIVDGEMAMEGETSYFIRGERKAGGPKKPRAAPEPPPAPSFTLAQAVTADQADRYAAASGDDNPIHVDPATAKAAGLPGVILHGLCTMAFAQRDLVRRVCDGDPRRLRSLGVRFAKPVFPGETLTLKVWQGEGGDVAFATENEAGKTVISNGRAIVE